MIDKLSKLYKELENEIRPLLQVEFQSELFSVNFKTAALSKSFEFNYQITSEKAEEVSLFTIPMLRGLCEDIIILKFIDEFIKIDKEELLKQLTLKQQIKLLKSQENFFAEYKPEQIIFNFDDKDTKLQSHNSAFKRIMETNGFKNSNDLPKVIEMANKVGLANFYDFMYRATSEFVHFSPHILLRMGWNKKSSNTFAYSTKNFNKYYSFFSVFYGSYLFIKLTTLFENDFNFNSTIKEGFKGIENLLMSEFQYPELITLEEMNIDKAESLRLISQLRSIKRNIASREKSSS